jgi:hypothetical protein
MPSYIQKDFQTKKLGLKDSCIRLYPLVCLHIGAKQCDIKFIKKHIKRLRDDPNGFGIYCGDAGECVTKFSKGEVYEQTLSPQEQMDCLVDEVFAPVKDKLLFGIRGNHGNRIFKEVGLSFDANLCHRLGIPYLGVSTFFNLIVNRSTYDLFFHHGADSGVALQAKLTKHENFGKFIDVDAIFTAHSHIALDVPPQALLSCDNHNLCMATKLRHGYICGSGYDSRSGYAEEKCYSPILPSYLVVEFDGRIIEGKAQYGQRCEIFRSDGQHKLEESE